MSTRFAASGVSPQRARARRSTETPSIRTPQRILGTSLFLSADAEDALEAWNVAGEPRIDLVTVHGLERVRHDPVAKLLQLENRAMLTPDALRRTRRRLAELPAASATSVAYVPREGGRADVEATVVERSLFPTGLVPLGAMAAEAAIDREVRVAIGSVTGGGEAFGVGWRWWERRPALAVTMSMPSPIDRVGAVWTVNAEYDQQTYGAVEVEERRRSATFSAADWIGDRWRWEAGAGVARWSGRELAVALNGSLARHAADDRWRIRSALQIYAGGVDTASGSLFSECRSKRAPEGTVWHARGGLDLTGDSAPLGLWPGAGTGHARTPLLRAHSLLRDGVMRDGVFGSHTRARRDRVAALDTARPADLANRTGRLRRRGARVADHRRLRYACACRHRRRRARERAGWWSATRRRGARRQRWGDGSFCGWSW